MKKIAFALIVAAGFAVTGANAQPLKVGVAAEPYPPFTTPDSAGNWTGWEIDFMRSMCAEAKLECVVEPLSWDGLIPALTSKKIDLIISSMSITKEREKTIDFSGKYYQTMIGIVGSKDVSFHLNGDDASGKAIGVQVGSVHHTYATEHFGSKGATVKDYQTIDQTYQDLVAGRLDAIEGDIFALNDFLNTADGKQCCELKGTVSDGDAVRGVGVGMRKGETELKNRIDAAITAIRANGEYAKFSKKYFSFDIYGN